MKFVVITSTASDLGDTSMPKDYPRDCLEIDAESIAEIQARFPGKIVLEASLYKAYLDGCRISLDFAQGSANQISELIEHVGRLKTRGLWARLRNKDV